MNSLAWMGSFFGPEKESKSLTNDRPITNAILTIIFREVIN